MSHGGGGEGSKAEPNLVPLLDIVMQLLMFFMMCVNFVSEQVTDAVKLPVAQSARVMSKKETDILFLNLNSQGELILPETGGSKGGQDQERKDTLRITSWKSYLRQQYQDAERLAKERTGKGEVNTIVVIRADMNNDYKQIYQLLQICKQVGYRKLQLRAETKP